MWKYLYTRIGEYLHGPIRLVGPMLNCAGLEWSGDGGAVRCGVNELCSWKVDEPNQK